MESQAAAQTMAVNGKIPIERLKAEAHCIERAWDRYRIRLTHEEVRALSDRIANGAGVSFGVPVSRINRKRGVGILIDLEDGRAIPVLFVPGIGCVTVLPPNAKQVIKAVMKAAMAEKGSNAYPARK